MSALQKLFKHTFIYGLATVLPRILTVLLTRLYTDKFPTDEYGVVSLVFAWMVFFNVVLSYGMETAFFRFINKKKNPETVQSTALGMLLISSLGFLVLMLPLRDSIGAFTNIPVTYITYALFILVFDALVVIPFAWLRHQQRSIKYTYIKITNVVINLSLNLFFFLALPLLSDTTENSFLKFIDQGENKISYVFMANLAASVCTLLWLLPLYVKIGLRIHTNIVKQMLRYGLPVLVAGMAFAVNEHFDKILLEKLLPQDIARSQVGVYSACYRLGVFMTLFVTAFKLGVEPFFFSHAKDRDAPETYARITLYFSIFAAFILLFVVVYVDIFKMLLIAEAYWEAMWIVPVILIANLFLGLYHNLSVWYKVTDRTRYGAYISVVGALITLVLNVALIPVIGYKGSALATLVAYGTMMILSYVIGRKKYPIPYKVSKISMYLGVSVLFSILSFYQFQRNLLIGNGLLLVFLTIVYLNEKDQFQKIISKNDH
ncbi:oligosaccharide flippase family protein [Ascidiimonas aurantiaca]|uniref:oligosaccharide flippase family protein n=1 Tax=Ascidiimonas aurantiaca TaxID=1685432 RepID=UPI0030EE46BA